VVYSISTEVLISP